MTKEEIKLIARIKEPKIKPAKMTSNIIFIDTRNIEFLLMKNKELYSGILIEINGKTGFFWGGIRKIKKINYYSILTSINLEMYEDNNIYYGNKKLTEIEWLFLRYKYKIRSMRFRVDNFMDKVFCFYNEYNPENLINIQNNINIVDDN